MLYCMHQKMTIDCRWPFNTHMRGGQDEHGDAYMSDDYSPEDYSRLFQNILDARNPKGPPAELAMCCADPGDVARAPHMRLVDCTVLALAPPDPPQGELTPHAAAATRLVLLVWHYGCVFICGYMRSCGFPSIVLLPKLSVITEPWSV